MPDTARHTAVLGLIAAVSIAAVGLLFSLQVHGLVDSGEIEARAKEITGGDPKAGKRATKELGCGGCHDIPGVAGASGAVGPPLKGIGRRVYIAGVLPNSADNLVRWILDPPGVDPKTLMPKTTDDERQARNIAAYLYTLE